MCDELVDFYAELFSQYEGDERKDAIVGSVVSVFLHELGHGLINQFGLPAVGKEEDAVDQLATVVPALLSAIRDEPDDVANREVLADQYEAAGDADRARFIRTQVARAALPRWDARTVAMRLDERALLLTHRAAWVGELPALDGVRYGCEYGDFERGLMAWVEFDDAALIPKHLTKVMAAAPISGLVMKWPRRGARPKLAAVEGLKRLVVQGTLLQAADMTWLAKSPILSTVQELVLDPSRLDDDALEILLGSPHLGKLRRLQLPMNQLTNDGLARLAATELPQLVELGLAVETMDNVGSGGRDADIINAEGVAALCEWPQMAKLEHLDLTGSQIGEAGLAAILTSKNTRRLTTLKIRSVSDYDFENDERPDVLCAFAEAKGDRSFEELDLGENELTSAAVTALISSPVLDKLRVFSFDFSHSDTELARLLDKAKWLDGVHVMSLGETTLGVVKKLLGRAPKALHTLDVSSSFPRSDLKGVVAPLTAGTQKALQSLDLSGCALDDAALKKLGAATKALPSLIELVLGWNASAYGDEENPYSDDAAKVFVASPLGKQLQSVVVKVEGLDRNPPPVEERGGNDDDDDDDFDDDDDE